MTALGSATQMTVGLTLLIENGRKRTAQSLAGSPAALGSSDTHNMRTDSSEAEDFTPRSNPVQQGDRIL